MVGGGLFGFFPVAVPFLGLPVGLSFCDHDWEEGLGILQSRHNVAQ